MANIQIKFPGKELGVIVEKVALEKEASLRDQVADEFASMATTLYDKANGGVVNVVSGNFRDSFFVQEIDTKNKFGIVMGFDPSKCSYIHFILGGTVFMPPRDIIEQTLVEHNVPNNIKQIIGEV